MDQCTLFKDEFLTKRNDTKYLQFRPFKCQPMAESSLSNDALQECEFEIVIERMAERFKIKSF